MEVRNLLKRAKFLAIGGAVAASAALTGCKAVDTSIRIGESSVSVNDTYTRFEINTEAGTDSAYLHGENYKFLDADGNLVAEAHSSRMKPIHARNGGVVGKTLIVDAILGDRDNEIEKGKAYTCEFKVVKPGWVGVDTPARIVARIDFSIDDGAKGVIQGTDTLDYPLPKDVGVGPTVPFVGGRP